MAEVASVDERQDLVVDSRVVNEGWTWAGSGANPWRLDENTESMMFLTNGRLDENTESMMFLTNEGNQPARIGFSVTAGGVHYYLTSLKLAPHETRAINVRQLRGARRLQIME